MKFSDFNISWNILSKVLDYKCRVDDNGDIVVKDEFKGEYTIPTKGQIEAKIKELELEEKVKSVETKTTQFIKNLLDELDYDNEGEVALYAANSESRWHDEAVALQKYIEDVYTKMYELQNKVRAGEDVNLDEIKNNYPKFEFKE